MKSFFLALLLANLVAAAWLWLQAPVDVVREPARMDLQIDPGRVHVLSDAEVARLRQKAESDAARAAAPPPPASAPAPAPAMELPLASCIDIGSFASEGATRKIRGRLGTAGLADRLAVVTADKITHLRLTGVDAAGEAQLHVILRDFPKLEMLHCSEAPAAQ
jgi:hypothetical protein